MTLEKLAELISNHVDVAASEITAESTFESLGIDSLDTVEIVMEIEEELGRELELDKKLKSVGELMEFIQAKLG